MFSHGRSLTKLALFFGALSIPVIGPPIVALAAIGLMLGGTARRPITDKERAEAIERNKRRQAEWSANEGKRYAAALADLKGKRQ